MFEKKILIKIKQNLTIMYIPYYKMSKLFISTIGITFLIGLFFGVLAISDKKSYFLYAEKDFQIELDTRIPATSKQSFSFADYDIDAPEDCKKKNVVCQERTIIHTKVEKQWEVIAIAPLWDDSLNSKDFSTFYPDLDEDQIISNGSHPNDKWIVQKILYERGLLDVFPTGKIGFKTEEAIAKLQHYKGIEEIDEYKNIIVIGPKTIRELNKLKNRMKSDDFIPQSPMPTITLNDFTPFQQERLKTMNSIFKTLDRPSENSLSQRPHLNIIKPENSGDVLKFNGKVEILQGD